MKTVSISARIPLGVELKAQEVATLNGVTITVVIRDFLARVSVGKSAAIAIWKKESNRQTDARL